MFRSLMTIIRELYLYLAKVNFMLIHWVSLGTAHNTHAGTHSALHTTHMPLLTLHCTQHTCRYSLCTAHNTHAALRHAATSPNLYNDVILPSVLT